ncbi:cupin domain-containing protein [Pseudomonas sp. 8Z]|uniref:cupin domain-containing protein n=1 Tax=Pseudomonas sp. 8Z TaxID=2653166 RepID=UPI002114607D|nr:cupin domain-containing protein [Pseudomonas sp. 8Z]
MPAAVGTGVRHSYEWGDSRLIEQTPLHSVLQVELKPGVVIAPHFHAHRSKHLMMLSGILQVEIAGQLYRLREGDSVEVAIEQVHVLSNPGVSPARFFEVRLGEYLEEDDVVFAQHNQSMAE